MAHRVSKSGSFRLDKRFAPPVGRLAIATGCTTRKAFTAAKACLERLEQHGRLDVLLALKERRVSVLQVVHADREDTLDALLEQTVPPEQLPLWATVESWLGPASGRGETVRRYGVSFAKLKTHVLQDVPEGAPIAALASIQWKQLAKAWPGSPADWNHCRRAVSTFLTSQLGDLYHPFRRALMKQIPRKREVERVPDLDVATFWAIVQAAPAHVRPAFVTLVVLGLRLGEYLRLRETDLHPITKTVSIPGTKTAGSAALVPVASELWGWVVAAVPAPVQRTWLRKYWKRALAAVGADTSLRLHDLRHLTAQLLVNEGRTEASVQTTMRHATASMTRRYAMQKDRGENAAALARALGVPLSVPQSPVPGPRIAR
jgi:integrase